MFTFFFFFFQAEDGIRDLTVTGVQTCALPIWMRRRHALRRAGASRHRRFARRGFPTPQPRYIEAPLRRGTPAPLRHLRTRGKRRDREFARQRDGRDEKAVARTHRARRARSAFLREPR